MREVQAEGGKAWMDEKSKVRSRACAHSPTHHHEC